MVAPPLLSDEFRHVIIVSSTILAALIAHLLNLRQLVVNSSDDEACQTESVFFLRKYA